MQHSSQSIHSPIAGYGASNKQSKEKIRLRSFLKKSHIQLQFSSRECRLSSNVPGTGENQLGSRSNLNKDFWLPSSSLSLGGTPVGSQTAASPSSNLACKDRRPLDVKAANYTWYAPLKSPMGGMTAGQQVQPPPDMPSLLLDRRIVFVGLPLVPQVTELLIAELMYLDYKLPEKPMYLYFNSPGTQDESNGKTYADDTETMAVYDTMMYTRPKKSTVVLGMAGSGAALLAAAGTKGMRYGFPHSTMVIGPPRGYRNPNKIQNIMECARDFEKQDKEYWEVLAKHVEKDRDLLRGTMKGYSYFLVHEAIQFGLLDKIADPDAQMNQDVQTMSGTMYSASVAMSRQSGRGRGGGDMSPAADA